MTNQLQVQQLDEYLFNRYFLF